MEYKFFTEPNQDITTAEWHKERDAAQHLEQDLHALRIFVAGSLARFINKIYGVKSFNDLGAGDGGTLFSLKDMEATFWGCDLAPKNVAYANDVRKIGVQYLDFIREFEKVPYAEATIMTETIEHLEDPHGFLSKLRDKTEWVIASSPVFENNENHYEFHLWAWDQEGYTNLFVNNGWDIAQKGQLGLFQYILAKRRA